MKKIVVISFLGLILVACGSGEKPPKVTAPEPKEADKRAENRKKDAFDCDKILISYYDKEVPYDAGMISFAPFSNEKIYELRDGSIIELQQLLEKCPKTGYCCCPERCYTISFYDKGNMFREYFVDTLETEGKAIVFESSFQFSYVMPKKEWFDFLKHQNTVSSAEYFIPRLDTARMVYDLARKNDLCIIDSRLTSPFWRRFDGDFKFKAIGVGEHLNEDTIIAKVRKAYPKDTFEIAEIARYQMCGSSGGNDCYEERTFRVYCNKPFFDKFNLYSPKSFFDVTCPNFYVIGPEEKLKEIDKITKREPERRY